jgi:fructokinase
MNVAYHLKKLGTTPALITKIGMDDYGRKLVEMLAESKVATEYIAVDFDYPTGLVYANMNDHHEVVYDIVNPSAWDFIEWSDELGGVVEDAAFFVYGSLTSRNKTSRDTLAQLLERAKTKVLDINLRPPHFHRSQVEYLLQQADIIKMNIAELELITGWFSHFQSTEDRMKELQEQFSIKTGIVTMGGDGALIFENGTFYRHPGYKVAVADTIGSGDSFLAGFLHQLLAGASTEDALSFASGIGAFVATQSGACPAYSLSQIYTLIHSNKDKQTIHHD